MLMKWPRNRKLTLVGLKTKVERAHLLTVPDADLAVAQTPADGNLPSRLEVKLPARKADPYVSVVVLDLAAPAEIEPGILQQPSGKIELNAFMGKLHPSKAGRQIRLNPIGATENWFTRSNSISWTFTVTTPGTYRIEVGMVRGRRQVKWIGGHKLTLTVDGRKTTRRIRAQAWRDTPRAQYFPEAITRFGTVTFNKPGIYRAKLTADEISPKNDEGVLLTSIELLP
jgi:hypothetical protein